jgi:hypothetical protein
MTTDPDSEAENDFWFGAKSIGVGYQPVTWQGWLVTAIAVAAIVGAARFLFFFLHGGIWGVVAAVVSTLVILGLYFWVADNHASPDSKFLG